MFVGRTLYLLGMPFVFFSIVVLIMSLFSDSGDLAIPLFALLNGLIAMGVGDLVIDVNHRQRVERMK